MPLDPRFHELLAPLSGTELAARLNLVAEGPAGDVLVSGVGSLRMAGPEDAAFFDGPADKLADALNASEAGLVCIRPDAVGGLPIHRTVLLSRYPRHALSQIAGLIARQRDWHDGQSDAAPREGVRIAPGATVGLGADIGPGTSIGPGARIGPGVQIGADCEIGANATIRDALIGNRVRIHSGARIGEAGFGLMATEAGMADAPQFGRVILQDDVTIGANSCIDRGAFDDTVIGEGTKIDNLCQIGHNCEIGRHCAMASFTGISGSTRVGDGVQMGGRVGIIDHVTIGDGAKLLASSAIMADVPPYAEVLGTPALPKREFLRQQVALRRLAQRKRGS